MSDVETIVRLGKTYAREVSKAQVDGYRQSAKLTGKEPPEDILRMFWQSCYINTILAYFTGIVEAKTGESWRLQDKIGNCLAFDAVDKLVTTFVEAFEQCQNTTISTN